MSLRHIYTLILLLFTHLIIPLGLVMWVIAGKNTCKLYLILKIIVLILFILLIYFAGYWGYLVYWFRYILLGVLILTLCIAYFKMQGLPFYIEKSSYGWGTVCIAAVAALILAYYNISVFRGHFYSEQPIQLAFPFKGGSYYIIDGGNGKASSVVNYHYNNKFYKMTGTSDSQKYALDIAKINNYGMTSKWILPIELEDYENFMERVYSPCSGTVFDIIDGYDSHAPFTEKYTDYIGNTIVIKTGDTYVLMCHLHKGSITVSAGDKVEVGQFIAKSGNTGMSKLPHLHIHAVRSIKDSIWSGKGVPIIFNGKFPIKNDIIKINN